MLIHDRLDAMNDTLRELSAQVARLDEQLRAQRRETVAPLRELDRRVGVVEVWRWKVVGAAAALSMFAPPLAAKLAKLVGSL